MNYRRYSVPLMITSPKHKVYVTLQLIDVRETNFEYNGKWYRAQPRFFIDETFGIPVITSRAIEVPVDQLRLPHLKDLDKMRKIVSNKLERD